MSPDDRPALRPFVLSVLIAASLMLPRVAGATCPNQQRVGHEFGSYFTDCSDLRPVPAFAFSLSYPASVHTGDQPLVCTASTGLVPRSWCQPEAGTAGDGNITFSGDWSANGFVGCPNSYGGLNGSGRIVVWAAPEGGATLLSSIAFSYDVSAYVMEAAHPFSEPDLQTLSCASPGHRALELTGIDRAGGTVTLHAAVHAPVLHSDCDAGVVGEQLGTCPGGVAPTIGAGLLYTHTGLCPEQGGTVPLSLSAWAATGLPASGSTADITGPEPAAGHCLFAGATILVDGIESPAIAGWAAVRSLESCPDADGDGAWSCIDDCDDSLASRKPGLPELCDNLDNDCDGAVDDGIVCQGACFPPVPGAAPLVVAPANVEIRDPDPVWTGEEYGLAWMSVLNTGERAIEFARLGADGNRIGDVVRVATGSNPNQPTLAWTGTDYGLAWMETRAGLRGLYFRRISAGGILVGPEVAVTTSVKLISSPSMVWGDGGFGLAWTDYRLSSNGDLFFARLAADGTRVGDEVPLTNPTITTHPEGPRIVWNGASFAIAWGGNQPTGDVANRAWFVRVSTSGTPLEPPHIISDSNADATDVSLVWTGSGYGAVWTDSRHWQTRFDEIYFKALDASGQPIGGDVLVLPADGFTSGAPQLVWAGSDYGLAWVDMRAGVGNFEVYFAGLDAAGHLVGVQPTRLTNDPQKSVTPALAWNGDAFRVLWSDQSSPWGPPAFWTLDVACGALDRDLDSWPRPEDCDDRRRDIHPGAAEICDAVDNDCDGLADGSGLAIDADGDGVAVACDNCADVPNADQADADHDGQGDLCDADDGLLQLALTGQDQVAWPAETGFGSYNVYRGDLAVLRQTGVLTQDPAVVPLAARFCGVAGASFTDATPLPSGQGVFYLITGSGPGGESSLGLGSDGRIRINSRPCP